MVKQETVTKTPKKEKDARAKEAGSKRRKTENTGEVKTPQHQKRSAVRRRKSSSAEPTTAGELTIFSQNEIKLFSTGGALKKKWNLIIILVVGPQKRSGRVTRQNSK